MQVNILLFGQLKELFQQSKISVQFPTEVISVAELREVVITHLSAEQSALASSLVAGKTFVAVNQTVAQETDTVTIHDEIALFPPVTGG